ncbi:hypothetical protein EC968_006498 [Mortierella alpina]|nr:hypothetical protein EC968_006498 [Mortierella alpina]
MPTPNALFGALQPSVVFPVTATTTSPDIHPRLVQQQTQAQQHPAHQQRFYSHAPHSYGRHPAGHHPCQQGPDSAVMEFITKIGQIIVKARTVSPVFSYNLSGAETDPARSVSNSVSSSHQQQQNLDMILQDMDIWRNSTPVHVNILHSAQHVLLERWVISFTPAATPSAAASSPSSEQTSGCMKTPIGAYHSPKTKQHLQHHQSQCTCSSPSAASTASSPRDTTDLVLLLQSLYTQIRSLPLQNCLTSFDDETRLAKADLAYSVTSANEDITQPRQDKTIYCSTQPVVGQQVMEETHSLGSSDEPYTEFANSLRTTLPLEFVQAASLKVINFEASHMHWGCVRVTGMYDESVGGRVAPENFQDSLKAQKKRHHRSKQPSSSSISELTAKALRRSPKEQRSWNSVSQPVKDDSTLDPAAGADHKDSQSANSPETWATRVGDPSFPRPASPHQLSGPASPDASPEEPAYTRLQSLKRSSDRLFSAFSPSRVEDPRQAGSSTEILQESLLARNDADSELEQQNQEKPRSFRFPPPPSPPLSIPLPRRDSLGSRSRSSLTLTSAESHSEKTPADVSSSPAPHRAYPPPLHYSPPLPQQQQHYHHHHHHSHHPFSTSPLAQVITRRRSSRLSIVMNCNDDSPDLSRTQNQDFAEVDEHRENCSLDGETSSLYSQRNPLQEQRHSYSSETHVGRPITVQSPSRHSYLRRSSLTPSSVSHGDLFGSLVGSYEESILSGRMSTLPSKPLIFAAQIGVLANQDYKDCPPKLRCPKHVQLEFPAVFYDYESSINHQSGGQHHTHQSHSHSYSHTHPHSPHHPHHNQHHHHHPTPASHPAHFKASLSFGNSGSISPSSHSLGSFASSPVLNSHLSLGNHLGSSSGSAPTSASLGLTHCTPAVHDDPVLPYVGNLDLDSGFRGSRRFARMPGGMRIPLRGQVQVVIKNPNKTAVKVFLVPYDFTDMPEGTKTFLRQKYYSTGPGMGPSTPSSNGGGTLRYAIHLQFCCPAPGYVYLYRSIRVVFANRVPDGKESLRVVLEGLGLGSKTIGHDGTDCGTAEPAHGQGELKSTPLKKIEERYVKMRKGEVQFTSSKRKKDHTSVVSIVSAGNDSVNPSAAGLGLHVEKTLPLTPGPVGKLNPSVRFHQQRHDFDGQPHTSRSSGAQDATTRGSYSDGGMSMAAAMVLDMNRTLDIHPGQQSLENGPPFSVLTGFRGREAAHPLQASTEDEDDHRSISSSALIGTHTTPPFAHYLQPLPKSTQGSPSMSSSSSSSSNLSSNLASLFPKESSSSSPYLGSPTVGRKQQSQVLGL